MSDALWDTTVFLDRWNGRPEAVSLVDAVINGIATASFSAVTSLELSQFENLSRQDEIELAALSMLLEEVPMTSLIANQAGQLLRGLSRGQRRRLMADAIIAATAMSRREKIYSRNERDIRRFYSNVEAY